MRTTEAEIPLKRLDEPARNPNHMEPEEYQALVQAIRHRGFLQPILVNKHDDGVEPTYEIIDGVHRKRAALEAGLETAKCIVTHELPREVIETLRIGMNKLRGQLNLAEVATIFDELVKGGFPLDELTVTGFSRDDIDNLLAAASQEETDVLPEAMESTPNSDDDENPIFVLELKFTDRNEYQLARRVLRRAAGKDGELKDGLLKLLGEEKE